MTMQTKEMNGKTTRPMAGHEQPFLLVIRPPPPPWLPRVPSLTAQASEVGAALEAVLSSVSDAVEADQHAAALTTAQAQARPCCPLPLPLSLPLPSVLPRSSPRVLRLSRHLLSQLSFRAGPSPKQAKQSPELEGHIAAWVRAARREVAVAFPLVLSYFSPPILAQETLGPSRQYYVGTFPRWLCCQLSPPARSPRLPRLCRRAKKRGHSWKSASGCWTQPRSALRSSRNATRLCKQASTALRSAKSGREQADIEGNAFTAVQAL